MLSARQRDCGFTGAHTRAESDALIRGGARAHAAVKSPSSAHPLFSKVECSVPPRPLDLLLPEDYSFYTDEVPTLSVLHRAAGRPLLCQ